MSPCFLCPKIRGCCQHSRLPRNPDHSNSSPSHTSFISICPPFFHMLPPPPHLSTYSPNSPPTISPCFSRWWTLNPRSHRGGNTQERKRGFFLFCCLFLAFCFLFPFPRRTRMLAADIHFFLGGGGGKGVALLFV